MNWASMLRTAIVLWLVVPAVGFAVGFGIETISPLGEFVPFRLIVFIGLPLLLIAALAVTLAGRQGFVVTIFFAAVVGTLLAAALVAGAFLPYVVALGERDLNTLGGDLPWQISLTFGLIIYGIGGAVVGAACGAVAWLFAPLIRWRWPPSGGASRRHPRAVPSPNPPARR